jgi:sulfhydrogenase subunit beta (sulfur reductase)
MACVSARPRQTTGAHRCRCRAAVGIRERRWRRTKREVATVHEPNASATYPPCVFDRQDFQVLLDALLDRGYQVIGPTRRDDVIVLDELTRVDELPIGWTEEQDGGFYRLRPRADAALFGHTVGPQSWKRYLLPPHLRLWQAIRTNGHVEFFAETPEPPKLAFLGVRACDLRAIAIQDRIFLNTRYPEPDYAARRAQTFIIAVNCSHAAATCFCASMQAGPKAGMGFDLALTEVITAVRHYFVMEVGSQAGSDLLHALPHRPATPDEAAAAERIVADVAANMARTLETAGLQQILYRNFEHPHWDAIAERCLTCGNCTLACPTCFCTTVEDVTDVTGHVAERRRTQDSCFSLEFSHVYGGSVRASAKARYRQWLTHKLATWADQFGELGCVGCGRCITWCPVGIDLTEEARTLRDLDRGGTTRATSHAKEVSNAST